VPNSRSADVRPQAMLPELAVEGGDMDFSSMSVSDWIIRGAIFGVLACVVIGTLQNLYTAIKNGTGK
jgi:hypothetical protein